MKYENSKWWQQWNIINDITRDCHKGNKWIIRDAAKDIIERIIARVIKSNL